MSLLLTDAEIEWMRDTVQQVALPGTCAILSLTQTSDGQGGYTDTWTAGTLGIACRIDPSTSREQLSGAAIQPFSRFTVTLPYDTGVSQINRLQIDSTQYNILGIDAVRSWDMCIRLEVEKV